MSLAEARPLSGPTFIYCRYRSLNMVECCLPYMPEARPPPRKFQIGTIANLNEVRLRLRRASPYQRSLRDIGRARLCRANVRARLAQKTREIFVFPTSAAFVEAKLAFAAIESVGGNTT